LQEDLDIETEWHNIQNIIRKAADESLGKLKIRCKRKYLTISDDKIKEMIQEKKEAYKKMA
jgi:hypothetical protein